MSQRERYLAIGVAVVLLLFGGQYVFNNVSKVISDKEMEVESAMSERSNMEKTTTTGKIAARKLETLSKKSLPTDLETLKAQYRDWLTEIGEDAEMTGIKVIPPDRPIKTTEAYAAYNFSLRGLCRTDRVLDLMGRFYEKDYLHKIRNLKVLRTKEKDVMSVQLDVQALALTSASADQEPSAEPSGRLKMPIDDYKSIVLNRNPFSPPNQPPRIESSSRPDPIERGSRWSYDLEHKDPESHPVDWEVVSGDLPPGTRFSRNSISGRPSENGEFEVVMRAKDRGWPSMSSEKRFVFTVVDPEPEEEEAEPLKFDEATQTFVSAMTGGRSGPLAWIRTRTSDETRYLGEGAELEIGTVKAKIVKINLREEYVELESSDGKRWTMDMDTSLAEAYKQGLED